MSWKQRLRVGVLNLVAQSPGNLGEVLGGFSAVSQMGSQNRIGLVDNRSRSTEVSDNVLELEKVGLFRGVRVGKRKNLDKSVEHHLKALGNSLWSGGLAADMGFLGPWLVGVGGGSGSVARKVNVLQRAKVKGRRRAADSSPFVARIRLRRAR